MVQEGYRLVKLSEHQVLVEFEDGSSENPSNWQFVSVHQIEAMRICPLTTSFPIRPENCTSPLWHCF